MFFIECITLRWCIQPKNINQLIKMTATIEKKVTLASLKAECKALGLKGYSKLDKTALEKLIKGASKAAKSEKETLKADIKQVKALNWIGNSIDSESPILSKVFAVLCAMPDVDLKSWQMGETSTVNYATGDLVSSMSKIELKLTTNERKLVGEILGKFKALDGCVFRAYQYKNSHRIDFAATRRKAVEKKA